MRRLSTCEEKIKVYAALAQNKIHVLDDFDFNSSLPLVFGLNDIKKAIG